MTLFADTDVVWKPAELAVALEERERRRVLSVFGKLLLGEYVVLFEQKLAT